MVEPVSQTLGAVAILAALIVTARILLKRRFRDLVGYERMVHLFTSIMSLGVAVYIFNLWGFFSFVLGSVAAAGSLAVIVGFSLVPWLTDAFVGLALYVDPYVRVGAEVEIAGKQGRIIEMSLTRVKIAGDECIYIVPNRKFREEILTLRARRPPPREHSSTS